MLSKKKLLMHLFFCWCLSGLASYVWLIGDDYQTLRYHPIALKYHAIGFLFFALALANLKAAMPEEFQFNAWKLLKKFHQTIKNDPRRLTWRKGK